MTSYLLLIIFWPMVSKHCNTNGSSMWTIKFTWLKSNSYLVTFHEYLGQLKNSCQKVMTMTCPSGHKRLSTIPSYLNMHIFFLLSFSFASMQWWCFKWLHHPLCQRKITLAVARLSDFWQGSTWLNQKLRNILVHVYHLIEVVQTVRVTRCGW